uniref:Uncharacterized protein n=1 Tax=Romanomermis culicivorax TaxID=13658 RepID=A0A915HUA1_ROMCU
MVKNDATVIEHALYKKQHAGMFSNRERRLLCLLHDEKLDTENSTSQFHSKNFLYEQWYANHTLVAKCFRPKNLTSNVEELEPCLDGYKWDSSEIKSSVTRR